MQTIDKLPHITFKYWAVSKFFTVADYNQSSLVAQFANGKTTLTEEEYDAAMLRASEFGYHFESTVIEPEYDLASLSKSELRKMYKRSIAAGSFVGTYKTFAKLTDRGGFELEHFNNYASCVRSETVIFQRRYLSNTIEGHTQNGCFLSIRANVVNTKWFAEICYPCESTDCEKSNIDESHRGQILATSNDVDTFEAAKKFIIKNVKKYMGIDLRIDDDIELGCYKDDWISQHKEYGPLLKNDIYITCTAYDKKKDAVVHAVTGIPLIQFGASLDDIKIDVSLICMWLFSRNDETSLRELTQQYTKQCELAVHECKKDHNQHKTDIENKCWCAWLLGEYIKDNISCETPVKRKTMIQ